MDHVNLNMVAFFSMYTSVLCIPPVAHIVKEELLISHAQLGLFFAIAVTVQAAVAIPSGFILDKFGTRKALEIGAIVMAAGSLMRGALTSFWILFGFICLHWVGFNLMYPNLPEFVGIWFPREKAGLAKGIYATRIATGASLALAYHISRNLPHNQHYPSHLSYMEYSDHGGR